MITPTVIYYRYTVILTEYDNLAVLRATYVVSFKPSNGGVVVSSHSYKMIGGDDNGEQSVGGPSSIDVKPLNDKDSSDDYLSTLLKDAVDYSINHGIKGKQLKDAYYQVGMVYKAYIANSGYPSAYIFLLTLVDNKGKTYRVQITTYPLNIFAPIRDQADEEWLPEYVIFPNT